MHTSELKEVIAHLDKLADSLRYLDALGPTDDMAAPDERVVHEILKTLQFDGSVSLHDAVLMFSVSVEES